MEVLRRFWDDYDHKITFKVNLGIHSNSSECFANTHKHASAIARALHTANKAYMDSQ